MRSIVALSVLFFAQALAKVDFGPCPTSVPFYSWNSYSANAGTNVYNHKVIFVDSTLDQLLNMGRSFVQQLPNLKCGDLYPSPLYYNTQSVWNNLFQGPADGIYQKMLWFDPSSKTEVIYYCMDDTKIPGVIRTLV